MHVAIFISYFLHFRLLKETRKSTAFIWIRIHAYFEEHKRHNAQVGTDQRLHVRTLYTLYYTHFTLWWNSKILRKDSLTTTMDNQITPRG